MRILVVDDDAAVRRSITRALQLDGFDVTTASSAEDALTVIAQATHPFAAIVSDVVMTGMSGVALAERLARDGVPSRVLLVTGYPGEHLRNELSADSPTGGAFAILHKPFTPADLTARVRNVIGVAKADSA